jgi:hypothetical protein
MSPRGTSQSGLAAFVLLVHAVGLLAALTQVAHRLWPGIEARAGVFVMGLVPPHPSLGLAAVLAVAYAGAVALLYERSRLAWWYCLALMAALFVVPGRGRHDWVVNAAVLVLLAVPRVRHDLH